MSLPPTTIINHFALIKTIGKGNFGTADLCVYNGYSHGFLQFGRHYVVKWTAYDPKNSTAEVGALAKLNTLNRYLLSLFTPMTHSEVKEGKQYIVLEFANMNDLGKYVGKLTPTVPSTFMKRFDVAIVLLKQILTALHILNTQNITHRDLKPDNVLLHYNEAIDEVLIKITDFGLATTNDLAVTHCGSFLWMAPEVLLSNAPFNYRCDIWAVGVMFYQMLFGVHPYSDKSLDELSAAIRRNTPNYNLLNYLEPSIQSQVRDLFNCMLVVNPAQRLQANALLNPARFPIFAERRMIHRSTLDAVFPGYVNVFMTRVVDPPPPMLPAPMLPAPAVPVNAVCSYYPVSPSVITPIAAVPPAVPSTAPPFPRPPPFPTRAPAATSPPAATPSVDDNVIVVCHICGTEIRKADFGLHLAACLIPPAAARPKQVQRLVPPAAARPKQHQPKQPAGLWPRLPGT
jgi:serine/threonine protein kinase